MSMKSWIVFIFLIVSVPWTEVCAQNRPFVDFDISGGAGSYNGQGYTETHLGINFNFTEWLSWRNTVFKRFSAGGNEVSGLDSSARFSIQESIFSIYGGPGYRWASNSSQNALFAEAGAGIAVSNLRVGAGVKYLQYDNPGVDSSGTNLKKDDLNYFFTISGGFGASF